MLQFERHHLRAVEHLDQLRREAAVERLRPRQPLWRVVVRALQRLTIGRPLRASVLHDLDGNYV